MHPRRSWSKRRHLHPTLTSWSAKRDLKREAWVQGTPVKPLVKPFRQTVSCLLRQTVSSNRSIKSKMFWKRRGLNSQPPTPQSNAITIRPRRPPCSSKSLFLVAAENTYTLHGITSPPPPLPSPHGPNLHLGSKIFVNSPWKRFPLSYKIKIVFDLRDLWFVDWFIFAHKTSIWHKRNSFGHVSFSGECTYERHQVVVELDCV